MMILGGAQSQRTCLASKCYKLVTAASAASLMYHANPAQQTQQTRR